MENIFHHVPLEILGYLARSVHAVFNAGRDDASQAVARTTEGEFACASGSDASARRLLPPTWQVSDSSAMDSILTFAPSARPRSIIRALDIQLGRLERRNTVTGGLARAAAALWGVIPPAFDCAYSKADLQWSSDGAAAQSGYVGSWAGLGQDGLRSV
ncbi:hypothetical protein B0H15DRAFT_288580 [Mycena belliarum]|uniref:Uncharacterized protein n=1 Tax=Mycena belliarum TaxID=1033014 RepID=A0AAD6XUQ7_9AGAR|nr:hypothetical protein B0H15DRAFT_288580 [Mycena belliae]